MSPFFPPSSLVRLTDTSASRQTGSQTKLFLWMDHYTRAAQGICEKAIQVSLPLGNLSCLQEFIFSAASLENDILTPFTWKSLCLLVCNSGLSADRSSLRAWLLMDIKQCGKKERNLLGFQGKYEVRTFQIKVWSDWEKAYQKFWLLP